MGILYNLVFQMITLTHVDTSTGVLTDVKSFAAVARRHSPNAIIVVDGVCATGGMCERGRGAGRPCECSYFLFFSVKVRNCAWRNGISISHSLARRRL